IRFIDWVIPVSILGSSALFALICSGAGSVLPHLLSGGLLFGAVFMATDYTTSPRSNVGKVVFGVIIGAIMQTCPAVRLSGGRQYM
ncbi:MAG: RnfABCDGE type electron transport complex subunit D, partial [Muribaculaceae bacterium]|nr:RnfABCDGE type electron transport complex subunit D [Muribaculaceae bacterium]